jgi:hypothetical protein
MCREHGSDGTAAGFANERGCKIMNQFCTRIRPNRPGRFRILLDSVRVFPELFKIDRPRPKGSSFNKNRAKSGKIRNTPNSGVFDASAQAEKALLS